MASIYEVKYKSGKIVTRVQFRSSTAPSFSLNFDDWEAACEWVEANEEKYYLNPSHYLHWKRKINLKMKKENKEIYLHMYRSKVKRKK